jgi:hypothetical protein
LAYKNPGMVTAGLVLAFIFPNCSWGGLSPTPRLGERWLARRPAVFPSAGRGREGKGYENA